MTLLISMDLFFYGQNKGGTNVRACSFVCSVAVVFLGIDQFYSGFNWGRLFIGGFVVVAIWTDCECWLRYKIRHRRHS